MSARIEIVVVFQQNMFGSTKAVAQANISPDAHNDEEDLRVLALGALDGIARPLRKSVGEVETSIFVHRGAEDVKRVGLPQKRRKDQAS